MSRRDREWLAFALAPFAIVAALFAVALALWLVMRPPENLERCKGSAALEPWCWEH